MVIIRKTKIIGLGDVEKLESSCIVGGNVNDMATLEDTLAVSLKVNHKFTILPKGSPKKTADISTTTFTQWS